RLALATAAAGVLGLAVWVVPMALEQPGGLAVVREHGARIWREAVSLSSPLYGAPADGIRYNLGQVGGYTLAAVAFLLPAAALGAVLAVRERSRTVLDAPRRSPRPPTLLAVAALPPLAFVAVFHFGKAGYVLSYLPALVLLLLWPAAALPGRQRLAVGALALVGCVLQALRFAGAPGLLPASLTDTGPWFTESRFGAPYRVTAPALRETDADVERHLDLGERFDPATHELVYVYLNGGHRYRHAMLTHPEFRAHYLQLGFHEWSAQHRRWRHERDHRVELAAGRRAVLVVDEPRRDVRALVANGVAEAVRLPTGPTVYVVPPGVSVYDVELVSAPGPSH
ncbi:MAG: hypothetical protein M3Q48_11790, partial [Actinomycetota bacterium]|nr:hypothetical protein [Actinomycetota bacterium]